MSAGDESEVAGTSSLMESTMLEGEECYNPEAATEVWTEKVSVEEQLCRICGNGNEYLIPIFSGEGLEHQLGVKIQKHLPIQVREHDKLPLQVCYQCASTLIAWHDLVTTCVEVEEKLRLMYQQEEEEDDNGADRADFFDDPVNSEMTEDPLKPSISKSATIKPTHPPRKKTVMKAKLKKKITATKPPRDLAETPMELLRPKEEQVEADPTSERIPDVEFCNINSLVDHAPPFIKMEVADTAESSDRRAEPITLVPKVRRTRGLSKEVLRCKICKRKFMAKDNLEKHLLYHETEKCKICNVYLKTKLQRENHHKKHEERRKKPSERLCPTCGKTFSSYSTFYTHNKKHHAKPSHACHMCDFKTNFPKSLTVHLLRHADVRPFMCETCGRGFHSKPLMISHQRSHSDIRPHACTECDATFKFKKSLKHHEIVIHNKEFENETVFSCVVCNQRCASQKSLSDHMNTHTGDRPYACNICDKTFRSQHTYNQHKDVHKAKTYSFACDHCTVKCNTKADLSSHKKKYHNEKALVFPCDNCDLSFDSTAGVVRHKFLIHKIQGKKKLDVTYTCNDCNKSFPSKVQLQRHMTSIHKKKDGRSFSCTNCEKVYLTREGLKQHFEAIHSGAEFPCRDCTKVYKSSATLDQHRKRIHMRDKYLKPVSCSICAKVFYGNGVLSTHQLVHTEKQFACDVCGKKLRKKWDVERHMRTHTGEKPYPCAICGRSFAQLNTRDQHVQNIHKTNLKAM